MKVRTGTCQWCGKPSELDLPDDVAARVEAWMVQKRSGSRPLFVQHAFPDLTADQREQLISGSHGKCFDEMFPEDDD